MGAFNIIHFILNIDDYIGGFILKYGHLTYVMMFLIIFIETGLVAAPFLPGDSLLFVAGTFAAQGSLNIIILIILLSVAAVLGDSVNYWIGSYFGEKFLSKARFIKRGHLEKTKDFYSRHGGKTIIYARFIPIVRTFAPFVAGIGRMNYKRFLLFNVTGGILWVALFALAGYYFGKIQFVKNNLTIIIYLIIFVSILLPAIEWMRSKTKK